jgi:diaminohydroxyphosphoribosylaminopyrimidine deaminase/5-amino-6-(5-phosphoribosylamino)uracil reductase
MSQEQRNQDSIDHWHMQRALDLARHGQGCVEPNPMVGCVVARGAEIVGEGWHRRFGKEHAEVEALHIAGPRAAGATLYVTLEPCCHYGKTPPCSHAIIAARVGRVVAAMRDPFTKVDGGGLRELMAAGIEASVGLMEAEAQELNAPYLKLLAIGRPWVIAKWAMTLDGKIATRTGASRWISGECSRKRVHSIRGRVDAILVGRGTVEADDPLLTARPPGPRTALRVVADTQARISPQCKLLQTARETPVLIAVGEEATAESCDRLRGLGCEVFPMVGKTPGERLLSLLDEFGKRRMTNILVEGGSRLLGSLADGDLIDEMHVFVAPKIFGGHGAPGPVGGCGVAQVANALRLRKPHWELLEDDLYLYGRVQRAAETGMPK